MSIAELEEYTLHTLDNLDTMPEEKPVHKLFWYANPKVLEKIYNFIQKLNITTNILDVGCGINPLCVATHLIDFKESHANKIVIKVDLDFEKIPYADNYFNYVYCRHTLEDVQNPQNAFNEITRVSRYGYIETPSPLVELSKHIDSGTPEYRGYVHHRYIVWSDLDTNTLYFLPKYPIVETITKTLHTSLLNTYPMYWNNYYTWDDTNKPRIVVYRNDINFDIRKDYGRLLNEAVTKSMMYTNYFVKKFL